MDEAGEPEHVHAHSRCPCRPPQRRSHKKSRNGCQNCKQRRIKCDERKPTCRNCTNLSLPCSFNTVNDTVILPTIVPKGPRKRGRPLTWMPSRQDSTTSTRHPASTHMISNPLSQQTPSHPGLPFNPNDIELYHHYITNASLTLGDDVMWRDKVPRLAFENHYVLRLMLALSAIHRSRLQATEAAKYEQLAAQHHSVALSHVTNLLPQINRENCSALYVATVLICNYAFAKGPTMKDLVEQTGGTEVVWWNLFRGVRFVIETMGLPAIFSGPIGPFPPENTSSVPPPICEGGYIPWQKPLAEVNKMIVDTRISEPESLITVCEALLDTFRDVFGTEEQPENVTHGKTHIVMRWLWLLEDDFFEMLTHLNPRALILLAYFSVLVKTLECFWFMKGWAHWIMNSVLKHLETEHIIWVSWPRDLILL